MNKLEQGVQLKQRSKRLKEQEKTQEAKKKSDPEELSPPPEKRQKKYDYNRLEAETDDSSECRLEQNRAYQAARMEAEKPDERSVRLGCMSYIQNMRLRMESDEERVEQMSTKRLAAECDEKREVRLAHLHENRHVKISAAGSASCAGQDVSISQGHGIHSDTNMYYLHGEISGMKVNASDVHVTNMPQNFFLLTTICTLVQYQLSYR